MGRNNHQACSSQFRETVPVPIISLTSVSMAFYKFWYECVIFPHQKNKLRIVG